MRREHCHATDRCTCEPSNRCILKDNRLSKVDLIDSEKQWNEIVATATSSTHGWIQRCPFGSSNFVARPRSGTVTCLDDYSLTSLDTHLLAAHQRPNTKAPPHQVVRLQATSRQSQAAAWQLKAGSRQTQVGVEVRHASRLRGDQVYLLVIPLLGNRLSVIFRVGLRAVTAREHWLLFVGADGEVVPRDSETGLGRIEILVVDVAPRMPHS
jgi:hypothetical protein